MRFRRSVTTESGSETRCRLEGAVVQFRDEHACGNRSLPDVTPSASGDWAALRPALLIMDDVLTLDRPAVFPVSKDRPILFSALAWADILLTLDEGDFGGFMSRPFTGCLCSGRALSF